MRHLFRWLTVLATAVAMSMAPATPSSAVLPSVVIPDANFAACIRAHLGLPPNALILDAFMPGITSLSCDGRAVSNLSGLNLMVNLVDFSGNDMALSGGLLLPPTLIDLESISLDDNELTSIGFPLTMTQLETVELRHNQLSSFSLPPTSSLIKDVHLQDNHIQSLSLAWMPTTARVHAANQTITLPDVLLGTTTLLSLSDHRGTDPAYTAAAGSVFDAALSRVHYTSPGTYTHTFNQVPFSTPYGTYSGTITQRATQSAATGKLGDHTGDGKTDIFGVDAAGILHFSRGSSTTPASYVGVRGTGWGGMTYMGQVNDITSDSRSDLLTRRGSDQSLWVYRSLSQGYLTAWKQMGQNWGGMDQIVPVFNLAGGSTQYVVARRASDGLLFRYTLTPTGLTGIQLIGQNWNGMRQILSVGDFNADGRSDVLAIRNDGTLWSYLGTPQGTIGAGTQVGQGWGTFIRAFSAGDMSGDANNDLLGQRNDGVVFVYNNLIGNWGPARQIMTGTSGLLLMA